MPLGNFEGFAPPPGIAPELESWFAQIIAQATATFANPEFTGDMSVEDDLTVGGDVAAAGDLTVNDITTDGRLAFTKSSTYTDLEPTGFHEGFWIGRNLRYSGSGDPATNATYIEAANANNQLGLAYFIKANGGLTSWYFDWYQAPVSTGAGNPATLTRRMRLNHEGLFLDGNTGDDLALTITASSSSVTGGGYAGIKLLGDNVNTAGEFGGAYIYFAVDGELNRSMIGQAQGATWPLASLGAISGLQGNSLVVGTIDDNDVALVRNDVLLLRLASNQLLTVDGTAGAPSWSFLSDANTGMYRGAENRISFSSGGIESVRIDPILQTLGHSGEQIRMTDSSATGDPYISWYQSGTRRGYIQWQNANPGFRYNAEQAGSSHEFQIADTDAFIINPNSVTIASTQGTDFLEWTGAGALRQITNTGGLGVYSDSSMVIAAGDTFTTLLTELGITATTTTENLWLVADNEVYIVTGRQSGAYPANTHLYQFSNGGQFKIPDGTASLPSLTFNTDQNTGIYRIAENRVGFSAGGVIAMEYDSSRFRVWMSGSAADPAIALNAEDIGFFRTSTYLGVSWSGTEVANFQPLGLDMNGNSILNVGSISMLGPLSVTGNLTVNGEATIEHIDVDNLEVGAGGAGFPPSGHIRLFYDGSGFKVLFSDGTSRTVQLL